MMYSYEARTDRSGSLFPPTLLFVFLLLTPCGCALFFGNDIPCEPPEGAVILFDGTGFSHWIHVKGDPVQWKIVDGAMKVVPGTDSIMTTGTYQDFQLHVEFNVPKLPSLARGQSRGNQGNSGVYLQRRYEVQILDSFGVEPEDYDCGALYRARPPDRNMCKEPGQWQNYNITFHAPVYEGGEGELKKTRNARITVQHNGVVIHDDVELENKTGAGRPEGLEPGPIMLQDHGNEVMFRNIWILPLERP